MRCPICKQVIGKEPIVFRKRYFPRLHQDHSVCKECYASRSCQDIYNKLAPVEVGREEIYDYPVKPYASGHLMAQLVRLYHPQDQHAEAEPLLKRSPAIWEVLANVEQALGPDHRLVAESLNNLGAVYRERGQYPQAEPLLNRALTIREKVLGPDHPKVAQTLVNMAKLYAKTGREDEAKKLLARAKRIRAKQ